MSARVVDGRSRPCVCNTGVWLIGLCARGHNSEIGALGTALEKHTLRFTSHVRNTTTSASVAMFARTRVTLVEVSLF